MAEEKTDRQAQEELTSAAPSSVASVVCDMGDDEIVILTKVDKAVCTNDTLEDLQRALTYEAIFSSLLEHKVLAMKRDCEERKRAKRLKRKSIGRIFCPKKIFSGARKSSVDVPGASKASAKPNLAGLGRSRTVDEIEMATGASHSPPLRSKHKMAASVDLALHADDSLASTLSNSSDKHSAGPVGKRNLLVRAQTHSPAADTSSSSSIVPPAANALATTLPASLLEPSYDASSLVSGYENGGGAQVHTSTMAEDSLTSLHDSIESLSFASSRCTVSFGGAEVIPEDTASLLYERARAAKRLRILEAKSISAQCSPILPRHPAQLPQLTPAQPAPAAPVNAPVPVPAPLQVPVATQTQTKLRFLPNQMSYSDSMYDYGVGVGASELETAYTRYFSRQNTSEDSANLTISTLLNQSDSLSLHAPIYGSAPRSAGRGEMIINAAATAGRAISLGDRFKSKSTSLLASTANGRSRPPPPPHLCVQPPTLLPIEQLEQLRVTSNIRVASLSNGTAKVNAAVPTVCSASTPYPVIITSTSAAAATLDQTTAYAALRNGLHADGARVVNGAIAAGAVGPGDTAKLNRMTSTSTGSSVAPTGCCAKTKASAREKEKEKQRFKPSWPSGQSGSDDEYRRGKRKYKRYHRCSDPVLVYPSPSGLQHCILSVPPNDPVQFPYNEDYGYDMQLQLDSDKNDDLEEIVPSSNRRHRRHRHHKHKKRHRHKRPKILVQDLESQVVKVIDPDDLPQRARWTIIATACLLLLMCLMLVGITLRMAPIIDDMGKCFALIFL